jgi:hypothetical protein
MTSESTASLLKLFLAFAALACGAGAVAIAAVLVGHTLG